MTSWKITKVKDRIINEASRLLNLRTAAMEADFPLTREQVLSAVTPVALRECYATLKAAGVDGMAQTHQFYGIIPAGAGGNTSAGVEVDRTTLIEISLTTSAYYAWSEQIYEYRASRAFTHGGPYDDLAHLPFDMTGLPTEIRSRLITWLNRAIRERRIADAALKLVTRFISEYCECTGELNQRWPELRVIFAKLPDPWPTRMRDVSLRANARWAWPATGLTHEWYDKNFRKMEGAASVLAGASLMDNSCAVAAPNPPVRAKIIQVATQKGA